MDVSMRNNRIKYEEDCVIKMFDKQTRFESQLAAYKRVEGLGLSGFGCVVGCDTTKKQIVVPFYKYGTLDKYRPISEKGCMYLFARLTQIILEAHLKGVVLLDIKPHNIAVDSNYDIVIIDIEYYDQILKDTNIVTTQNYRPPEFYARTSDTDYFMFDVYAISKTIQSMLTGKKPVGGIKQKYTKDERFRAVLEDMQNIQDKRPSLQDVTNYDIFIKISAFIEYYRQHFINNILRK
jgi:serine/threonine protein kinase